MKKDEGHRNLVAAFSYCLGFVSGLVIILVEKDDKFVRFHALQSILVFGGLFLLNLILGIILAPVDFLGLVGNFINLVFSGVILLVWVVSMVKAYSGRLFKWPIVGNIAEKRIE